MKLPREARALLGLNTKEKQVFEALSDQEQGMSELVHASGLPRMTIYSIMDRLSKRGLVTTNTVGARKKYSALPSRHAFNKLADIAELFSLEKFPHNKKVNSEHGKYTGFTTYSGAQHLSSLYRKIVEENARGRFYFIVPNKAAVSEHGKIAYEDLIAINKKVKSKNIIADGILEENWIPYNLARWKKRGEDEREFLRAFEDRMYNVTVVPSGLLNTAAEIYVFKNVALLINWEDEVAVEIRNDVMVEFLKNLIALLKSLGTKIDLNEMVRIELSKLNPLK